MDTKSLAHRATLPTTREQRGFALFRDRGDEIVHLDGWRWRVPSCSGEVVYVVDLRHQSCTCPDHRCNGATCKHLYAGSIARAKTADCGGCGRCVRRRDLHPVPEDHPTLGGLVDLLCYECGRDQEII